MTIQAGMDNFNLERFLEAQRHTYDQAIREIARGKKQSHWMWYIFPQLAGLGHSSMAQQYAIKSLNEAKAYLSHPTLGYRLHESAEMVLGNPGNDISQIFIYPDDIKLRSSMTLFESVSESGSVLRKCLINFIMEIVTDSRSTY